MEAEMELLVFLGAFVALDILAVFYGYDSRDAVAIQHHERALEAVRRGQLDIYSHELAQIERELLKDGRGF
jgi:hypothetical protein